MKLHIWLLYSDHAWLAKARLEGAFTTKELAIAYAAALEQASHQVALQPPALPELAFSGQHLMILRGRTPLAVDGIEGKVEAFTRYEIRETPLNPTVTP